VVQGDWCDNIITGDARNEQINAGGGNDIVNAGAGNDLIYGDWGDDIIDGGDGNDLIYGGGGDDTLSGGAGDDTFRVTGSYSADCTFEGYDSYSGGAGQDRIVAYGANVDIGMKTFGSANGIETIDATGATGQVRLLGDWNDNVLDFSSVSLLGNIVIGGGGGNDTIIGSAGNDVIEGGDWGDQSISGGAGNDVIHGGGGDDTLSAGTGDDTFRVTGSYSVDCTFEGYDSYDGGAGQDKIVAFGGDVDIGMTAFSAANGVETIDATGATGQVRLLGDWNDNVLDFSSVSLLGKITINGGGGNDTIIGSTGDDVIAGGDWGDQTISGGAGNDIIHGGTGTDILSGGAGDDTFRVTGNKGKDFEDYDIYDGGAGLDRIVAYGNKVDIGMTSFSAANSIETIDVSGAQGLVRILGDWNNNVLDFSYTAFIGHANVDGGGGNDAIIGSAGADVINGGDGNDILNGGLGNDQLTGGSGKDAFAFGKNWGHDVVTDFKHGTDKLNFHDAGAMNLASLSITATGANTLVSFGGQDVLLQGVQRTTLTASDFVF
jgi:Ca2+-binding RTX toxin-like protein